MSDHNANQDYPEFNAQSVANGYWEVYHDDDCGEAFDWFGGAVCPKCGFRPDMQSIAARKIGKAVSQSAERMTAEQFWQKYWGSGAVLSRRTPDDACRFAAAYAEHCTAALQAELRVAIEDGDADFWKARAESSAALIRELAQALTRETAHCKWCRGTGQLEKLEYDDASNSMELSGFRACENCKQSRSLLSDPAVKKVLEK